MNKIDPDNKGEACNEEKLSIGPKTLYSANVLFFYFTDFSDNDIFI